MCDPQNCTKILKEVAPEAIEKFIMACNARYPHGPPSGTKTKQYKKDKGRETTTGKEVTEELPPQYSRDDQQTTAVQQISESEVAFYWEQSYIW